MVDFAHLSDATALMNEITNIGTALDNFDAGGRIIAMTISGPQTGDTPNPTTSIAIPTAFIDYPPQMVDAIRAALDARRDEITQQLSDLGVTNVDPGLRAAPAPAKAKKGKSK